MKILLEEDNFTARSQQPQQKQPPSLPTNSATAFVGNNGFTEADRQLLNRVSSIYF